MTDVGCGSSLTPGRPTPLVSQFGGPGTKKQSCIRRRCVAQQIAARDDGPAPPKRPLNTASAKAPAAAAPAAAPAAASAATPAAAKKRRSGGKQPWHNTKGTNPLRVGERVRAKYLASSHMKQRTTNYYWYNGVVSAVHPDGSVDVTYDDADDEKGVKVTP